MDLGTILSRVDSRQYPTVAHFMADIELIGKGAQEYWGDDPRGLAEVSRAKALEDHAWEAVQRRVSADLRGKCEALHAGGGPGPMPEGARLVPADEQKPGARDSTREDVPLLCRHAGPCRASPAGPPPSTAGCTRRSGSVSAHSRDEHACPDCAWPTLLILAGARRPG